jgi:ring-1,2-phenylacetyl-CoA epoxidase subunit PaaD
MGDNSAISNVMKLLEGRPDPEVPVLNILDLGIVRDVRIYPADAGAMGVTVMITPTYNGCPAVDAIRMSIRITLSAAGFNPVDIRTTLTPAWSTDWMSDVARDKLEAFGIAPPNQVPSVCHLDLFQPDEAVRCPRCGSYHTELVSRFGSTACKALYRCLDCQEPFDYFKSH